MKKILPVALVLSLALALMIVPAFADTVYTALPDDRGTLIIDQMPPPGQYVVECVWPFENQSIPVRSEPFELFIDPTPGSTLLGGSLNLVIQYDDGTEGVMSATLIVGEDFPNLDADDPDYLPDAVVVIAESGVPFEFSSLTFIPVSPAPDQPDQSAALDDFLDVVSGVGTWLITALTSVTALFYTAESGLTLLGVLCVVPLGLGLIFLLVFTIVNWLRFRS